MKFSNEDFQAAIKEHLTDGMLENSIQELVKAAITMLPDDLKEAAQTPGNYLNHTLRACACMNITAGLAQMRGTLEVLQNYQEKPQAFADQIQDFLKARLKKDQSS